MHIVDIIGLFALLLLASAIYSHIEIYRAKKNIKEIQDKLKLNRKRRK